MARLPAVEMLAQLQASEEPVTFYDALSVIRPLRGEDPPDALLHALVALHDAEHSTDGARTVIADYLRALVRRHETQRHLATRPLTLKDHGKTVRAPAGAPLQLRLDERRALGFRWDVQSRRGGGEITRSLESNEYPSTAVFDVKLHRVGTLLLSLLETPPPTGAVADDRPPRHFNLRVVIEPRR